MVRKLIALALFGCGCTAALAADDKADAEAKKLDKGKLFDKMDANGDGKVTKEEFTKFHEAIAAKLKDAGKGEKLGKFADFAPKLFDKMDANGDGSLSKAEYEKGMAGGLGGLKGKFDFKKKD